jgi:hypothetical protein
MRPGWALPSPRGQRCSHDSRQLSSRRLPPPPAARPCHPVVHPVIAELGLTRHHQEFTCVRPSDLSLARLLPRTEQGPLGFSLELRTPAGRTYRRTSRREPISNTDQELHIRHNRPPICELTRCARPHVAHCQNLWIGGFQATSDPAVSSSGGMGSGVMSVGRSSSLPI